MKFLRSIVLSWDFWIAIAAAVLAFVCMPGSVLNGFAKDIYGVGISVLSIVFSVYFAALAIIISSSDDDFVRYLESGGHYSRIVATFEWTLSWLFIALIYSIVVYMLTSLWANLSQMEQPKWMYVVFCLLFTYSLFAAFFATGDALKYAKYRARFVTSNKKE